LATKRPRRRWVRVVGWFATTLLALYIAVRIVDSAWYWTQRPASFRDANWSGEWRTSKYGGLSGRLLIRLPDPLPENKDFKAAALVYYPVYSLWKTGEFVMMDFTGHFRPDAPTSTGTSTNEIPGGKLKFKGAIEDQVIDYAALIDEGRLHITGGYLSRSPDDYGSFWAEHK
jgi:hypothetical protein